MNGIFKKKTEVETEQTGDMKVNKAGDFSAHEGDETSGPAESVKNEINEAGITAVEDMDGQQTTIMPAETDVTGKIIEEKGLQPTHGELEERAKTTEGDLTDAGNNSQEFLSDAVVAADSKPKNPEQTPTKTGSQNKKAIGFALISVIVVVVLICGMVFMTKYQEKKNEEQTTQAVQETKPPIYDFGGMDGSIPLSKSGQNVIIIMLDRAIGAYVPYIFDELPELLKSYQGFTYYPNTVSYGHHTNFAVPALYGGYEYTPTEINKRDTETLKDKHNEALKVLPVLFAQNDYWVTVCDPPYANYSELPDVSIYDNYRNINAFNLIDYPENYGELAYDPTGNPWLFDNDFEALTSLSDNTIVMENSRNTMAFIQNDATHFPKLLKTPEYVPAKEGEDVSVTLPMNYEVDGKVMHMDDEYQVGHYQVNVACLKALATWFDYLKEQGVYDNTKIIICADHGYSLYQFDDLWMSEGRDVQFMNPLLLVKDFNATGDLVTDNTFMTNADVPTLAVENTIENPVNPFTGKLINSNAKTESDPLVTTSANFYITTNNGNVFDTSDGQWWSVHDDIRVESNWSLVK